MPQFDPSTFASQLFWLLITFTALYFLMARLALPRIAEVLEQRQERIANDLARAEDLRKEAEGVIAQYEAALAKARAEAMAVLQGTQQDIAALVAERQEAFGAELAAKVEAAEKRIADARAEAKGHVRDIAIEVSQELTARLAGKAADAKSVGAAVDARLKEAR